MPFQILKYDVLSDSTVGDREIPSAPKVTAPEITRYSARHRRVSLQMRQRWCRNPANATVSLRPSPWEWDGRARHIAHVTLSF
ncbi:hypothetical protein [Roseovarius sp. EL26]|uniref:hypothetical protein n=1 Tax=Roseovarius sp. EL26 TaxID=2126672 RepID=UPI00349F4BA4